MATTTEASGGFNLSIPAGDTGGEIVVTGGTDLATGLANTLVLTAPFGATEVNPFTTLLDDLMRDDPSLTESGRDLGDRPVARAALLFRLHAGRLR